MWRIGLYRENAIVIESEANDSFGGNVYNVTMQITLSIPEFNVMFIVTYYTSPPIESSDSFWMTRSQRSRRRDKSLRVLTRNDGSKNIIILADAQNT